MLNECNLEIQIVCCFATKHRFAGISRHEKRKETNQVGIQRKPKQLLNHRGLKLKK